MKAKRTAYYCPNNDKHDWNGFQITTYDKPPKCSICESELSEVQGDKSPEPSSTKGLGGKR